MDKKIKKIISYVLITCMLASGILVNIPSLITLGAGPSAPTVDTIYKYVFGNGFPLLIVGDSTTNTTIYHDVNGNGVYDTGTDTVVAPAGDLSSYWIFGGGKDITVASTKITMTGGQVGYIYGGGLASQGGAADANVTGNIDINITGGTTRYSLIGGGRCNYTGKKADVGGTININIKNKMNCANLIGGSEGYVGDDYNPTRVTSTVHNINISISDVDNGRLYFMLGSGKHCNQIGNTTISIKDSSLSNDDIRNGIYGGIESPNSNWTKEQQPKKVGDVLITLDNVTFGNENKYEIFGGGYYSGITGKVTINIKDTTGISYVNGGGYAAGNVNGNISGDVSINVSGDSSINNQVYAGGKIGSGGESAYVGGKATIDISGTTSVSGVFGKGNSSGYEAIDTSVKGGAKVYVSGEPSVSSYYGIDLSTFVDNKVIVNGELTGSTAKIGLKNPSSNVSGTVVATVNQGFTVNTSVFNGYSVAAKGNDIVIDSRSLWLSAAVTGVNGVSLDTEMLGSYLSLTGDSFTGISVGDDVTSWFSDAASLGITVKVKEVTSSRIDLIYTGKPNKVKEKTFITITVPATKFTSGLGKKYVSTGGAYWTIINPGNYNSTHTLTNITAASGTEGTGKVSAGTAYKTTLTPATGFALPKEIEVTIGGNTLYPSQFTYDRTTGEVIIPGNITAYGESIEIKAIAIKEGVADYYLYFDADDKKLYDEVGNEYKEQLDKWSVDVDGNLVLNGFEFITTSYMGISLSSDTKLILAKDSINTIKCIGQVYCSVISIDQGDSDKFTIEGAGVLNIELTGNGSSGIYSGVDTYIKDATIRINHKADSSIVAELYGIYIRENLYIINSDVTVNFENSAVEFGFMVNGNINVDDSEVDILLSPSSNGMAMISMYGNINLESNMKLVTPKNASIGNINLGYYNLVGIVNSDETIADNVKLTSKTAKYFVSQNLMNITATKDSMGTRKATAGNDYTTTLTAAKGYKLPSSITVKVGETTLNTNDYTYDQPTGKIKILAAKVTGAVTIVASGEAIKNDNGDEDKSTLGDVKKEVNKDEKAPEMSLNNGLEELEELIFTKEEKEQIKNGADAKIYLEIKDVSDTVSEEDKLIIKENIEDFIIGEYIDISLFKKIGEGEAIKISNPNGLISITIIIPESLKPTDSTKTRNYKIARIHEGELTIIDGVYDAETGEFTFETDKFSTYAIIYEEIDTVVEPEETEKGSEAETETENNSVKTGDDSHLWLWMLLIAGAMTVEIVAVISKTKKSVTK